MLFSEDMKETMFSDEMKQTNVAGFLNRAERALKNFETAGFRLVQNEPSNSRPVDWFGTESTLRGPWTKQSVQLILADWESRIRLLKEAVDLKTNDIMDEDMAASEDAVSVVFAREHSSPGNQSRTYDDIRFDLTIMPFLPPDEVESDEPVVRAEALASYAARRIQDIVATASATLIETVDDIDYVLFFPMSEMELCCNNTAMLLNAVIRSRIRGPILPIEDAHPMPSSTPSSSSFSVVAPFSFLLATLSNLASRPSKAKQY